MDVLTLQIVSHMFAGRILGIKPNVSVTVLIHNAGIWRRSAAVPVVPSCLADRSSPAEEALDDFGWPVLRLYPGFYGPGMQN